MQTQIVHSGGIIIQQTLQLNGSLVVAERTMIAVAQHIGISSALASDDHEALVMAEIDDIDVVLADHRLHRMRQRRRNRLERLASRQLSCRRTHGKLLGYLQRLLGTDLCCQHVAHRHDCNDEQGE